MGYKPTGKLQFFAVIAAVLLIIFCAFLVLKKVGLFEDDAHIDKESYDSYSEFRKDTSSYFMEKLPDSATDFKYHVHLNDSQYDYAVSFKVDSNGWFEIHNFYIDYFSSEKGNENYIEEEPLKLAFLDTEGLTYVKQMMPNEEGSYRVVRYVKKEGSSYKSWTGVLYNKDTGRVIIFDSNI